MTRAWFGVLAVLAGAMACSGTRARTMDGSGGAGGGAGGGTGGGNAGQGGGQTQPDANESDTGGLPCSVAEVKAGGEFTCARRRSGSLWCWGNNEQGQLGDGTMKDSLVPVKVIGSGDSGGTVSFPAAFVDLAEGWRHTCARSPDGHVWCWGDNRLGQLGDGTMTSTGKAVLVAGIEKALETSAGNTHTCVRADAGIYCMGLNVFNQLGTRNMPWQLTAQRAEFEGGVHVGAAGDQTCATRVDGTLWCWGMNLHGELGTGAMPQSQFPPEAAMLAGVEETSGGTYYHCARKKDGTVWCMGDNSWGMLGDGTQKPSLVPVQVEALPPVVDLEAGPTHACARTKAGALWCWGRNEQGQLGRGTLSYHEALAAEVVGLPPVTAISNGDFHSCALTADGKVWCWGGNRYGQLGDQKTADRAVPMAANVGCD